MTCRRWPGTARRRTMRPCDPDCCVPDQPHAEPETDWIGDWPLTHGESERRDGAPGYAYSYYCLCGHPDYLTCPGAFGDGSVWGMTVGRTE